MSWLDDEEQIEFNAKWLKMIERIQQVKVLYKVGEIGYFEMKRRIRAIRKDYKKVLTEPSENSKI